MITLIVFITQDPMLPVIALIGQPNVGKSTLFNRLTRSRDALVGDTPGLTRDRQYGYATFVDKNCIIVDTGGINFIPLKNKKKKNIEQDISEFVRDQSLSAIYEADEIVFLVDGRQGLSTSDFELANLIRQLSKTVWLVVNKTEGLNTETLMSDFFELGLETPIPISAAHGDGVRPLFDEILDKYPHQEEDSDEQKYPRIAVIGRPNVGKSTLINYFLKEERMVVFDEPGTTRDSVEVEFSHNGQEYILVDTAGMRRRSRIRDDIEKYSVIKTLQALNTANVAILMLDASDGITEQDVSLAGHVIDQGRSIVIVANKCDLLDKDDQDTLQNEIDRRLPFLGFAKIIFLSAKKGTGTKGVMPAVDRAYESAFKQMKTRQLNAVLEQAVNTTPPPIVRGRRIKLKFAHQGGKNPPTIVVHGNQTKAIPDSYRRYLANVFRKAFALEGTPVRLSFKQGKNPFEGRKKPLSERQLQRRRRQKRRLKKKYA